MPLLESGNLEVLLDPKGNSTFFKCKEWFLLRCSASNSRPDYARMRQILELLREEKPVRIWMNNYVKYLIKSSHEELDELNSEAGQKLSTYSSLLILKDDNGTSPGSGNTPLTNVVTRHRLM